MDADNFPAIDTNIDYRLILPIQQKRTIAFVNNFIMNTVSFINHFAQSCESRLMEFEYKIQKVEAALLILESQLSSIPGIDVQNDTRNVNNNGESPDDQRAGANLDLPGVIDEATDRNSPNESNVSGVVASLDPRFSKFFKMVQVGVPAQAVKNKMAVEGFDPNVLDKPNEVIPGYSAETGDSNISTVSSSNSH